MSDRPTFYDNDPLDNQVAKLADFILDTCPDQIEGGAIETAVKIIAAWNTRATDPALAAAQAVHGEPFWQTVNKIICEESAWIGCPNRKVAERVAFAALVWATRVAGIADSAALVAAEAERDAAVAQMQAMTDAANDTWSMGAAEGERRATAAIAADLKAQADRREMEDFGHPSGIPLWLADRYTSGDHLTEAKPNLDIPS